MPATQSSTGVAPTVRMLADDGRIFKVLIMDNVSEEGLVPLRTEKNIELTIVNGAKSEDEVANLVREGGFHALMVRSATSVTPAILEAGKATLMVVGRAGVGVDNIDIPSATKLGIFVVNSPFGNVAAAAEHTVAMIFSAMRNIPEAHISLAREKKWDRARFVGAELKGRCLGVIGCGQVGSRVVRIMRSAGMNVVVYDPFMNEERAEMLGVTLMSTIEKVFGIADVVTLHLPKTPQTMNLVNRDLMMKMKPGSVIVNVARGGILNETDCVEVLKEGHLRCAAVDVFSSEPIDSSSPFLLAAESLGPHLILTPHLGASTEEAQLQVAVEVAEQCVAVFGGKVPSWAVNKCKAISTNQGYELDEISNLTDAAEFVGHMLQQLVHTPITQLNCTVEGDHFIRMLTPETLCTYAAVGFLRSKTEQGRVNIVNVESLCKTNCMELTCKAIPHERHSEFRITAVSEDGHRIEISATVSARLPEEVLIRSFCGVPCHMKLSMKHSASLIYSIHNDVPGVLAKMTGVLASREINIADCHLARLSSDTNIHSPSPRPRDLGHLALALVLVDDEGDKSQDPLAGMESLRNKTVDLGCIYLAAL